MFNQVSRFSLRQQTRLPIFAQQISSAAFSYRAAVILHGNGVYDGTECTEAVAVLVGLSRAKAQVQCFAPNRPQMHVVNHTNGEEDSTHERNVMVESARICRGDIKDIAELKSKDFDTLIIPGGFGAAKNLSNFGVVGDKMTVHDDVASVLKDFKDNRKIIGLSCIAPVLAAKTFEGQCQLEMTMGGVEGDQWPFAGASEMATGMGHDMKTDKNVEHVVFDMDNLLVTTPAYMQGDAKPHEVLDGMQKFISCITSAVHQVEANKKDLHIKKDIYDNELMEKLVTRALDGAWGKYDLNKNGRLTIKQAGELIHDLFDELNFYVPQAFMDSEFDKMDDNHDGEVDKTEMIRFMHNISLM